MGDRSEDNPLTLTLANHLHVGHTLAKAERLDQLPNPLAFYTLTLITPPIFIYKVFFKGGVIMNCSVSDVGRPDVGEGHFLMLGTLSDVGHLDVGRPVVGARLRSPLAFMITPL